MCGVVYLPGITWVATGCEACRYQGRRSVANFNPLCEQFVITILALVGTFCIDYALGKWISLVYYMYSLLWKKRFLLISKRDLFLQSWPLLLNLAVGVQEKNLLPGPFQSLSEFHTSLNVISITVSIISDSLFSFSLQVLATRKLSASSRSSAVPNSE